MDRIPIIPMTVEGIEARSIFISAIMYYPGDTERNLYYGFYDAYGIIIPNGEGNLTMPGGFGEYTDNVINTSVPGTDVLLRIVQMYSDEYQIQHFDGSEITQATVTIPILPRTTFTSIVSFVFSELSINSYDAEVLYARSVSESVGLSGADVDYIAEFVQGLVDEGLYNDWVQVFSFIGDSVNNKKINLLNHHDALSQVGTVSDSADGLSILNDSGASKLTSLLAPGINGFGMGDGLLSTHPYSTVIAYFKNPTKAGIVNGAGISLITDEAGDLWGLLAGDPGLPEVDYAASQSPFSGSVVWRRVDAETVNVRINGASTHTFDQAEGGFGTNPISLQVRADNGGPGVFSFVAIGPLVDDTKIALFEGLLNDLITNLNREA